MTVTEVRETVREGMCLECPGTKGGTKDCAGENLCDHFHEECAIVNGESHGH